MTKPKLSVVMIAKDAGTHLRECLASVAWADEIIVLENGSRDDTVNICRECGVVLHQSTDWPGFGVQKNRALAYAKSEWVLSLDADEVVTLELANEIQAMLRSPTHSAYEIPRLSNYCGRWMRHSGWWPDPVLRLFRRDVGRFSDDQVHEKLLVQGDVGRLQNHLLHYSFDTLEQVLDKANRYSTAGALQRHARGQQGGLGKAVAHGLWTFIKTYFIKCGFLDGREGFILAVSNAEGAYYRYLKLMYRSESVDGR
jgi:glycosyltransferase involved in cell wall biosynthesis